MGQEQPAERHSARERGVGKGPKVEHTSSQSFVEEPMSTSFSMRWTRFATCLWVEDFGAKLPPCLPWSRAAPVWADFGPTGAAGRISGRVNEINGVRFCSGLALFK